MANKPCRICGSEDRFPSGPCRPCAKRRALTPEQRREYQRQWYAENKEKNHARIRRWIEKNPDKNRAVNTRKHHKKRGVAGEISKDIYPRLFAEQMGICVCCGDMLGDDYHLDHIMPITLGGTNDESNLQLLKAECNIRKSAKHPDEWRKTIARVV